MTLLREVKKEIRDIEDEFAARLKEFSERTGVYIKGVDCIVESHEYPFFCIDARIDQHDAFIMHDDQVTFPDNEELTQ